jgi:hypothetical protein
MERSLDRIRLLWPCRHDRFIRPMIRYAITDVRASRSVFLNAAPVSDLNVVMMRAHKAWGKRHGFRDWESQV